MTSWIEEPDEWQLSELRSDYLSSMEQDCDTSRNEVIAGRPVGLPARSPRDGALAFGAFFHIYTYLHEHPRGQAYRPAPRFIVKTDPLTIRQPDVAFLETHKLVEQTWTDVCPVAPDLIVEVLTDVARTDEIDRRVSDFFAGGTAIAWILDACTRTLVVRRANGQHRVFGINQKVYSAPVLPRLNLRVYELFGE